MTGIFQIIFTGHAGLNRDGIVVGESYRSALAGFRFIRYRSIHIHMVAPESRTTATVSETGRGHCDIFYPMDAGVYSTLSPEERIPQLYNAVFNAMLQLAGSKGWNAALFRTLHERIMADGYLIPIAYYPDGPSPSRRRNAVINYRYTPLYAEFLLHIHDIHEGTVKTMPVFRCDIATPFFSRFFTFKEWVHEDLFVIKDTHREIHFVCDLLTSQVVIELHPDVNSGTELRHLLQELHYLHQPG